MSLPITCVLGIPWEVAGGQCISVQKGSTLPVRAMFTEV